MTDPVVYVQIRIIEKCVDKIMEINFSKINEVKILKNKLIESVNQDFEDHMINHNAIGEYCDCKEYDDRAKFCRKLLSIINKLIEELENEN